MAEEPDEDIEQKTDDMKEVKLRPSDAKRYLVRQPKCGDHAYRGFHFTKDEEGELSYTTQNQLYSDSIKPHQGTVYGYRTKDR